VNNYLFPLQGHPPSLDLPGPRRTCRGLSAVWSETFGL
jgi:hypothetical protein